MEVKSALAHHFEIKDMDKISYFLGVKVLQDIEKGTIWIGQSLYTENILQYIKMDEAKSVKTPVNSSQKLMNASDDSVCVDKELYQCAVGKLLYLSTRTRPDILFAVSRAARYTSKPTEDHWKAINHILRYLVGTTKYGLLYSRNISQIDDVGYSDADWGGDLDDRKSTSGYIFQIAGGPVSWCSRKQSCVALSTSEAEYIALTSAAQEGIWLRQLISEILKKPMKPVTIYEDNQSTICLAGGDRITLFKNHSHIYRSDFAYPHTKSFLYIWE